LASRLAHPVRSDLTDEYGQPAEQIAAAECAQSSKIVFKQEQPEVAEDVVDVVIRQLAVG